NKAPATSHVYGAADVHQFVESPMGSYGVGNKKIFRFRKKGSALYPDLIFTDTSQNNMGHVTVDSYGNLVISGDSSLTVIAEEEISQTPVHYLSDQVAEDNNGNILIAKRANELIVYSTHPENPSAYLNQESNYTNELKELSPRSITIDRDNNIWIGTRHKGIYVFKRQNKKLTLVFHLTSKTGLSENFVSYLAHDDDSTIWACTPSGLDKINILNNKPVIENLTRQNNIYQYVTKVVIDKNKTAWALTPEGLIKITPEKKIIYDYTPRLILTRVLTGPDTLEHAGTTVFSHRQNYISFYFAAPSFLGEKQILYSYWLEGSNNQRWSEPADNASVSFAELMPGSYTLHIKAIFPAERYPEQTLSYSFSVTPPWWQTWWFRTIVGIFGIGMLVAVIRLYYLGKLEQQKTILEKQQAIEKERTRIATDMHDDLGAGLSRIKFLSETIGIKKQKQEPIEDEISSIRNYSHEMIDKMGEIVWALNEKNDSLNDLLAYTRSYAVEYLTQNGIRCTVETADEFPSIFVTGEFRRNIFLAVKEALHNIVKHAGAEHVFISFDVKRELQITIKDDGCGFQINNTKPYSNGLINMRKRMKELDGSFEIINMNGIHISLSAPLTGSPPYKEENGRG
ncbi:MAG TPA: histidine kinase, partial [Chitinophagaceae bacterium]|nr:histidine kinase [Chitinophagaceae bacterium]